MKPVFTAVGRYFVVYVNGEKVSQHTTEREAAEKSSGYKLESPDSVVEYTHEYRVEVDLEPLEQSQTVIFDVGVSIEV